MQKSILLTVFILAACTQRNPKEVPLSTASTSDSVFSAEPISTIGDFEVKTFIQSNGSYGYEIFMHGEKIIYQPTIPGLPGNIGFSTAEKARQTGSFVVSKILNNQLPPSVSPEELDSLGVLR